ncbi:histidine phosphatase family protein [Thermodesulfobacteriota bacterium]
MRQSRVYLLRHGEIDTGGVKRFVGQQDLPLSAEGIRQARLWHETLESVVFAGVFCSDLERCCRTAEIVSGAAGNLVRPLPELREICLGDWEGLPREQIRDRFPQQWREREADLTMFRPPGAESFADLEKRVVPAFERAVKEADGDVLIVAHSGVNRVIVRWVLGMPMRNLFLFAQDYACLNMIIHNGGSWQLGGLNLRPGSVDPRWIRDHWGNRMKVLGARPTGD